MKVMPGKRNAVIAMTAVFVLLIIMLCAGAVCPETAQGDKGRYGDVLSFSAAPGFYAEPFYLSIDAPADEIYYTLDGTDPDRDSIRYTGPIYVYDVSSEPNVYCEIKDVSPFYDDELKELFYGYRLNDDIEYPVPDYKVPEQNIDKCTVIKAVWYDKTGNKSDVLAGSYFVGKEEYTRDDLVTISLFTDPASFFDHRSGIYVLGDRAEEYFEEISEAEDEEYREELLGDLWEANYTGRGREWERQATLQVFKNGG
ncbi:MAG: chitobiase/beta-hexosaminidase C-terminal domain-containing protein, partial [Lachnospiraceae bacterium]|nr:chitobiase/beta-hexosaminidase C-terminal domain-containing protein [Lachnospiraceae bacterium]